MAGRRLAKGDGRPRQTVTRAQRRRASLAARMAEAVTPVERLTAAFGYAASALRIPGVDPVLVQAGTEHAIAVLVGLGDELLNPTAMKETAR